MATPIKSTTDYSMFDAFEVNRTVNEKSFKFNNLIDSMKNQGWIDAYPMHCIKNGGKKLKIKGGHHRFRAAQILDMPVKYVVCNDTAKIHELETAGPGKWSLRDYFDSYCKQGSPEYLVIREYVEKTGISLRAALSMFFGQQAGSGNFSKLHLVENGKFEIKNYQHPKTVGEIIISMKSNGVKFASEWKNVIAISKVVFIPRFNADRLKAKVSAHAHILTKKRTSDEYLLQLEEIYNYHSPKKARFQLSMLAQQEADRRNKKLFNK